MAFPTAAQLTFKAVSPQIGTQELMATSTVKAHPLGTKIRGVDVGSLGYGEGEFVYLKGVASTAAGDLVLYDPVAGTTTRAVSTSVGPIAVALSANVASQYGWYQVLGQAAVNTASAGTGAANAGLSGTSTAGQATVRTLTATTGIDGVACKAAQDTPTTGFTQVALHYPCMNGIKAAA